MMSNVDVVIHKYMWLHSVESADGSQLGAMKAYDMDRLPISVDLALGLDALLRSSLSLNIQNKRCDVSFGAGRVAEATVCSGVPREQSIIKDSDYEATFREGGGRRDGDGRTSRTNLHVIELCHRTLSCPNMLKRSIRKSKIGLI